MTQAGFQALYQHLSDVKRELIIMSELEKTVKQDIITIDGKDYIISELPLDVRNTIVARQEILTSKVRHEIELEKIEVLTNHYNEKIKKGLEIVNGSNSKSTD